MSKAFICDICNNISTSEVSMRLDCGNQYLLDKYLPPRRFSGYCGEARALELCDDCADKVLKSVATISNQRPQVVETNNDEEEE